jgi:hypothetical protein
MKLTREQIENILEHYKGQPASKFAEALEVQDVRALCDAALQVEAMREAIGRAVADLKRYYDHQAGKNYHQIRSDLEQSLNPKNEEGKEQALNERKET